jgi:hypothetical protein
VLHTVPSGWRHRARTLRRIRFDDQLTDRHIAGEAWRSFDES